MIVGFTGTRHGMTPAQESAVRWQLTVRGPEAVGSHGDCVGADAQFHQICRDLGLTVRVHPPADPKFRAGCFVSPETGDWLAEPAPYKTRDRAIANECAVLIAAPRNSIPHGGTWFTVRYAKRRPALPIVIVWPDGSVVDGWAVAA